MTLPKPTLTGNGFKLRPWAVDDAEWYVTQRDNLIYQFTTENPNLTISETEAAIIAVNQDPNIFSFAIVKSEDNRLVGNITMILNQALMGEMMYWLAADGRGRGLATKALNLLCQWAISNGIAQTIMLKTKVGNSASQKVAKRSNFQPCSPPAHQTSLADYIWYEYHHPTD